MRGWRDVKRWNVWKDEETDWASLVERQRDLAARLVSSGSGLVLPGDEDWVDPPTGMDDSSVVKMRLA